MSPDSKFLRFFFFFIKNDKRVLQGSRSRYSYYSTLTLSSIESNKKKIKRAEFDFGIGERM